jgi:hypothetical protein
MILFISGTILSGFSILCCGECRVQTKDDQRLVTLCVNVCIGVSPLFIVTFMLVGWFWSIAWGVNMVTLAGKLFEEMYVLSGWICKISRNEN